VNRAVLTAVFVLVIGGAIYGYQAFLAPAASVFTGGAARLVCSAVFTGGRDEQAVRTQDLGRLTAPGRYLGLARVNVDHQSMAVRATLFGLWPHTALYRPGIGCTPDQGISVAQLRAQGGGLEAPPPNMDALWPQGEIVALDDLPPGVDELRLSSALDRAFAEPDPAQPRNTRAVVVVHQGRIVAERYAEGFGPTTGHLSNSMAKTVIGALVGILVGQGKLDTAAPAPIAEWQGSDDPRGRITLEDLLRMRSGLEFEESYTKVRSDITLMFASGDLAGFAAAKPLVAEPAAVWQYSTGTSNILGRIVAEAAGATMAERFAFPRQALFDPLGMTTAVLEVDGRGNFIAGSLMFASARDYARFGLLYLRDGVWNGRRILPADWVEKTLTPTPEAPPTRAYGYQVWLNSGRDPEIRRWPRLPHDVFIMHGHQAQQVVMVPSHDLVVVRLGLSEFGNWDLQDLVIDAMRSVDPPQLNQREHRQP
jgi:CubicO group peptidase (beta-lactamase class C family)